MGSFSGTLLVAPVVLLFAKGGAERWKKAQILECAAVFVCLLCAGLIVFCGIPIQ